MLNLYFVKMTDQIEMSSAQTTSSFFGTQSQPIRNTGLFGTNSQPIRNPSLFGCVRVNDDVVNERIRNSVNKTWIPFNGTMGSNRQCFGTFAKWPKQMEQTPSDLVKSGFYYTGQGDLVTCFMCGLTLKDWERGDVVDLEHKKWSPGCKYLCAVSFSA